MTISTTITIATDDLDEATIQRLRDAVTAILAEASDFAPDPDAVEGWTAAAARELLRRLRASHRPVQAEVLAAAARNGGSVDRAAVYEIGQYPEDRSLKGFTRPVARIMRDMVTEGLVPSDAANPMSTQYDPTNPSFQQALGFEMPSAIAPVFAEAASA